MVNNNDDLVTISKVEYERLRKRDQWLDYLEAAGVDNWEGIDYAWELKRAENHEQEDD